MRAQVAIVGAGLSGLYAALLLDRAGIDCTVLEARGRIGGRILSVGPATSTDPDDGSWGPYDLGPAWVWPDAQPRVRALLAELGIGTFPQHAQGAFLAERAGDGRLQRYAHGFTSEPPSMRLVGGMRSLVAAIATRLQRATVRCAARVTDIALDPSGMLRVDGVDDAGPLRLSAASVIVAMPPRLLSGTIRFAPELPRTLHSALKSVPTWMAGNAKMIAIYDAPFWRVQGLSGAAASSVGPLAEIHDASPLAGLPALFGFVGLKAAVRAALGREELHRLALAQLVRLFGPAAATPLAVKYLDWSQEADTAVTADQEPLAEHPTYGPLPQAGPAWRGRLAFAGTEVAPRGGGYLEGALEAALVAVDSLRDHGFGGTAPR